MLLTPPSLAPHCSSVYNRICISISISLSLYIYIYIYLSPHIYRHACISGGLSFVGYVPAVLDSIIPLSQTGHPKRCLLQISGISEVPSSNIIIDIIHIHHHFSWENPWEIHSSLENYAHWLQITGREQPGWSALCCLVQVESLHLSCRRCASGSNPELWVISRTTFDVKNVRMNKKWPVHLHLLVSGRIL